MNFPPFGVGVPLSAALPVATQFSAAGKITQSVTTPNGQVVGVLQGGENGVHYIRPIDANAFAAAAAAATQQQQGNNGNNQNSGQQQQQQQQQHHHQQHQQQQTQTLITLPITMPGAKPGDPQQHVQIQVVNPVQAQVTQQSTGPGQSPKYHISQIPIQTFGQGATVLTVAYNPNQEGIQIVDGQNGIAEGMTVVAALQPQDIQLIQTEPDKSKDNTGVTPVALIKSEITTKDEDNNGETTNIIATSSASNACTTNTVTIPAQYLQNATSVQEYIQKMQHATTLPLSLQQFLKFNNPEIKREQINDDGVIETINIQQEEHDSLILNDVDNNDNNNSTSNNNNSNNSNNNGGGENDENPDDPDGKNNKKKKKYKKKPPKPKKPKPGQVHIATALDGTTLFCCPECHMAYPEKELLEQHLIGHKIERRFICDICGAGLKRKEHLERHKLGHNPERPFVCSVCMKGFKRKEHLNLHFVIHSGEKTEICGECGKGFYRKDHLRKHARSHITRRAKEQAERSQNQIIIKEPTTTQVTIQVPTSQMQIPVQIQVPQHHIQVTSNSEEESNQVSTVVLPTASEGIILPQN